MPIWQINLLFGLFAEVNITRPENERDDIDHKCLVQVRDPAMLYMSDNPNNAVSGKWKKPLLWNQKVLQSVSMEV